MNVTFRAACLLPLVCQLALAAPDPLPGLFDGLSCQQSTAEADTQVRERILAAGRAGGLSDANHLDWFAIRCDQIGHLQRFVQDADAEVGFARAMVLILATAAEMVNERQAATVVRERAAEMAQERIDDGRAFVEIGPLVFQTVQLKPPLENGTDFVALVRAQLAIRISRLIHLAVLNMPPLVTEYPPSGLIEKLPGEAHRKAREGSRLYFIESLSGHRNDLSFFIRIARGSERAPAIDSVVLERRLLSSGAIPRAIKEEISRERDFMRMTGLPPHPFYLVFLDRAVGYFGLRGGRRWDS